MKFIQLAILIIIATFAAKSFAKKPTIGFLLSSLQDERYQKDRKFFADKVKELGGNVLFYSSHNNEKVQIKKMENLLMKDVDVVVMQPIDSNAAAALVDLASKENVPVIAYDRIINNANILYYITQDSKAVGKLQAQAAVKKLAGKGNIIILAGQADDGVAQSISAGVKEVLKKYPRIKIVSEQAHEASSASLAQATVKTTLVKYAGKIHAILAHNSAMANAAVNAVASYNKSLVGKIFIAGADADLASMKNLVKGVQQFEVLKDIQQLAETSATVAVATANGDKINFSTHAVNNGKIMVPVVNTPVFPVTKDKIDEVIIKRGLHTKAAIYNQ